MCGRFSLRLEWIDQDQFVPRYNIAPRSLAPVIRHSSPKNSARMGTESLEDSSHQLVMQTMKWGLVPHWSKYEDKSLNTINARSENLVTGGGMWNSLRGRKRCVVVCQGYYEWLPKGKDKIPHFIKPKRLYDSVELQASNEFAWLHDRQPVILSTQEDIDQWLDTSSQRWSEDLAQMVSRAYTKDSPLECYQVPKEVGKIGMESSSFILPISVRKDGIEAMFSKQKQAQRTSATKSTSTMKRKHDRVSPKSTEILATTIEDGSDSDIEILEHHPPSAKKVPKTYSIHFKSFM
ncbi:hypothetical protein EV368DRAFT_61966 [Lentinula lateritia]|nr:hypothetical protein EV368DRAFT_61966 [Lentinula lateritia]